MTITNLWKIFTPSAIDLQYPTFKKRQGFVEINTDLYCPGTENKLGDNKSKIQLKIIKCQNITRVGSIGVNRTLSVFIRLSVGITVTH